MTLQRSAIIVRRSTRSARRAFSLVELVVVIGIIVLLVGLTVGVMSAINRGSETRQTENLFKLLDTAYGEWRTNSDRDVTYGIVNTPLGNERYEIRQDPTVDAPPGTVDDHEATDELVRILLKNAPAKAILANLDAKLLVPATAAHAEVTARDAWGVELITVFPGRLWINGDTYAKDPVNDGTIRTEFENAFGACVNRRLRFVSAGPDGRFGDLSAADGTALKDETKDNIYSYPLEAP